MTPNAGQGRQSAITGSQVYRSGGGGAGQGQPAGGTPGQGGGGSGSQPGQANTGGGAGGGNNGGSSASGGSGVVILRYSKGPGDASGGTKTTDGSDTIHTFNNSGTFTA